MKRSYHYIRFGKVNKEENQRSFIIRSDRGCEETLYIKNNCLPDIFSSRLLAIKALREKELSTSITKIEESINKSENNIQLLKEKIKTLKETKSKIIKNLNQLK